jgi:choline dehydrogenase-like flavoprotein
VRAERVVLAGGAIENARLLLASADDLPRGINNSGWLGRGFMEHPRDRAITLTPTDDAQFAALAFFDARVTPAVSGRSKTLGRLALTRQVIERDKLLNASATLLPNVQPLRERIREVMKRRTGVQGFRRWLPESGHGWSEHPARARVFSGFTVLLNVEQPPRLENAVTLSDRCDRFGVPLAELRWQWHADDQASLERVRLVFATALEHAGFGKVSVAAGSRPDPNAHHHAGTTRMHADARYGVVDANGKVHGSEFLHVVGASTFPSAGFANPTLTIVAMALRLAEHLA